MIKITNTSRRIQLHHGCERVQPDRVRAEKTGWHWTNITLMASVHMLALGAFVPAFFHWSGPIMLVVMFFIVGCLGVCLGYHRMLTHRSLRSPKAVEYILTMFGTMSFQGSPLQWVGTHRIHHKESDGPDDPHSPGHGFTWSHMLWCFFKHPDGHDPLDFTRDLQRDRGLLIIDRFFILPQIVATVVLLFAGWMLFESWTIGLTWVIWGVAIRTVFMYHATWFVNSAAHTWGYRNFDTPDGSRNNWWVALISFGEGWHNNHHAQQRSAAHGMRWWEFDPTYWVILLMEKIGLAQRVIKPIHPDDAADRQR